MSDIDRSEVIEYAKEKRHELIEFWEDYKHENREVKYYDFIINSLETDEAYQLEYEKPEFCKADNSVLEDINKMLAEINGEIACAEYHEVECNHKTEKQDGRRVIAKIVHKYCDKYMESE